MVNRLLAPLSVLLFLLFSAAPTEGHRVTIFAWIEGMEVHTVSKLAGGPKVVGAPVSVHAPDGTRLIEGKTDEDGRFSFSIPRPTGLDIVLDAGAGHQAEWHLPENKVKKAFGRSGRDSSEPQVREVGRRGGETEDTGTTGIVSSVQQSPCMSVEEVREIVREAVAHEMNPVMTYIAESRSEGPDLAAVFGGAGYIIGLFGIYFYMAAKRREKP